jgi:hypothetical protein
LVVRIAGVEVLGLVQFRVTERRRVGAQSSDAVCPQSAAPSTVLKWLGCAQLIM